MIQQQIIFGEQLKQQGIETAIAHADSTYEFWLPVKDYEGLYEVSNFGRVKSLARINPRNVFMPERIMSSHILKKGYRKLTLSKSGINKKFWVHRLVAIAFIPNPENKKEVNHIDCNPSNNHVSNLEWVTPSENMKHVFITGRSNILSIIKRGHYHQSARPVIQKDLNGNFIKRWDCITYAARSFGRNRTGDICSCMSGKQKSAYGFKWERA